MMDGRTGGGGNNTKDGRWKGLKGRGRG